MEFGRWGENGWTASRYAHYRMGLGLVLAVHFAALIPWGAEIWSSAGVLPDAELSPFIPGFPNLLAHWDAPESVVGFLALAVVLSLYIAAGIGDRVCALLVAYALACLFGRNPLIANPSLPFLGWLLLAHALAGPGARDRATGAWRLSRGVYACAWLVMAAGYSYSGLTKLASPSWLDGSALSAILSNPLSRPTALRDLLLSLDDRWLAVGTWAGLSLELLCLPLALVRGFRPWLWLALVGMHLGLLVLLDFADLTAGMLVLHAYTFDPRWWERARAAWPALDPRPLRSPAR